MALAARCLTGAVDGFLGDYRALTCDRNSKCADRFRDRIDGAGGRVVQTPIHAPNANACAEQVVRAIRDQGLHRLTLFGERRRRHAVAQFVAYYHGERNHQGLDNELITPEHRPIGGGQVRCRERSGGLLRDHHRAA